MLVERSVHGDLEAFAELLDHRREGVPGLDDASHAWTLTPSAVRDVMAKYGSGGASSELVNSWAWFMRRGHLPTRSRGPARTLEIDYTPAAEEEIAHILSRLSELGDTVDGEIDGKELAELMASLDAYC